MSKLRSMRVPMMIILIGSGLLGAPDVARSCLFMGDVSNLTGGDAYNGSWSFSIEVVPSPAPGILKFKVLATGTGMDSFIGDAYDIPITSIEPGGMIHFDGGNDTGDPDTAGLDLTGTFNPNDKDLAITSIVSGGLTFKIENIKHTSEPGTISLLAFGALGLAGLRRRQGGDRGLNHPRRSPGEA